MQQCQQFELGGGAIGLVVAAGQQRRDLLGAEPELKEVQQLADILGRLAAVQPRIQIGHDHVVGLDGLEAAGLQRQPIAGAGEDDRRRGVADASVAVAGLALKLGGRAGRRPRLGLVGLVLGQHLGVVDQADDPLGVDTGNRGADRLDHLIVVVEQQRRVEVGELQGAEHVPFAAGVLAAGGDHGTAGAGRGRTSGLDARRERHPVAVTEGGAGLRPAQRREAHPLIALGGLREADQHQAPVDLVGVAPLDDAQRRVLGVSPGAGGVAEQRG